MKEIILNGMNKEEIMESLEGADLMKEGLEMLLGQLVSMEAGGEVPQREIRKAQLKLQESYMIMKGIEAAQKKRVDTSKPLNRTNRRRRK